MDDDDIGSGHPLIFCRGVFADFKINSGWLFLSMGCLCFCSEDQDRYRDRNHNRIGIIDTDRDPDPDSDFVGEQDGVFYTAQ
jgi:hypothetical protein